MSNLPGVVANATIDGVHTSTPAEEWTLSSRFIKDQVPLARGGWREGWAFLGADREMKPRAFEVKISWDSILDRSQVEELLGSPPPHELSLWRKELETFLGNGVRTEFTLPRPCAIDPEAWASDPGVPSGLSVHLATSVKVTRSGTPLTFVQRTAANYETGSPTAMEVWFEGGGRRFKLGSAPANGDVVFVWYVPLFSMLQATNSPDKRLTAATFEPHGINLVEGPP